MDKEVDPAVLGIINETPLMGEKRPPVEIIARMGVFDAREKAGDLAWIATGDRHRSRVRAAIGQTNRVALIGRGPRGR